MDQEPAAHAVQTVAPTDDHVPAAQGAQLEVLTVKLVPAGQGRAEGEGDDVGELDGGIDGDGDAAAPGHEANMTRPSWPEPAPMLPHAEASGKAAADAACHPRAPPTAGAQTAKPLARLPVHDVPPLPASRSGREVPDERQSPE